MNGSQLQLAVAAVGAPLLCQKEAALAPCNCQRQIQSMKMYP